jgi:YD repeat-containing protein
VGPSYARFSYDATFSQLTSAIDAMGRLTRYQIDPANGNMLSMSEVAGAPGPADDVITAYTYTSQGLVDTMTDPLGRVTDYDYDLLGRLIQVTMAQGTPDEGVMQYEYDAAGNVTATVDPNGNRTQLEYDLMNRLTRVVEADPDGADPTLQSPVSSFTYDAAGNVLSSTDSRDNETTYGYDARDRVIRVTDARGKDTQFQYDREGNLLSQRDELGHETRPRYDARHRPVEMTDPDGGRTRYEYDADDIWSPLPTRRATGPGIGTTRVADWWRRSTHWVSRW